MRGAGLSSRLAVLMAAATGTAVAAIYLSQPILATLGRALGTSRESVGLVATLTQVGYGLGILLLVPLGDVLPKRRLVLTKLALLGATLAATALAPSVAWLCAGSLAIGALATVAQDLVPLAADLATPERRGQAVGTVMSGLLLGILGSRTFSGAVAQALGWRAVFVVAALLVAAMGVTLAVALPAPPPPAQLRYVDLLRSMATQVRRYPRLRRTLLTHGLIGFAFSAFWTNLSFFLSGAPHRLDDTHIGMFGLAGAAGALIAPVTGRLVDKRGPYSGVLGGIVLVALAFAAMTLWPGSLPLLIGGTVVFDLGMQMALIAHQTIIYALDADARARLNAVFVSSMFFAFSIGSFVSVRLQARYGWRAVLGLSLVMALGALSQGWAASRLRDTAS